MPLTPEQSQQVSDLRRRMLDNVAAGKATWDGFTREELQLGLESLRGGRARMAEAATKGRKAKAAKDKGTPPDMSFLKDFGLE